MARKNGYEVRLTPEAAKALGALGDSERNRVRTALMRLAADSASSSGWRGGKSLKRIRGRHDRFFRLRVGDLRIIFDLLKEDGVLLVHGIINRRDLERWLRQR